MTALADKRMQQPSSWRRKQFTLASGLKAYQSGICSLTLATGLVQPGAAGLGQVLLGVFAESIDASATGTNANTLVDVDLTREINLEWFDNDTAGTPISGTTGLLQPCYILDDHTVTGNPSGNSVAGIVWGVDASKGVAVERTTPIGASVLQSPAAIPAFAAGASAPASIVNGAVYDVPTTAAASVITLPSAASDGTFAYFKADGTKNANTVQYADATGPTNLTTALTASKRHLVLVMKMGGKWFANAYVGP